MADYVPPSNMEEYNSLYKARTRIYGYGFDTGMSIPCPFCCAPEFLSATILEWEEAMKRDTTCKNCGRSAKSLFSMPEPGCKQFELVQTGGDDLPDWLPPLRRV